MLENKHQNWAHYKTIEEGLYWPEGQAIPSFSQMEGELDTYTIHCLSDDAKIMLSTMQGLVNRKKTRIYLNGTNALQEGLHTWPERLGIRRKEWTDLYGLVKKYAAELDGVVLYNSQNLHVRNLAGSIAGIKNLLPVEESLYTTFADHGIDLKVVCDLTGLTFRDHLEVYRYLYDTYWKDCSRRIFVSLNPVVHTNFTRDMAAAVGAGVVWLDSRIPEEKEMLDLFLQDLTPGKSIILGWWPEERSGIGEGTSFGVSTIPSDFYENSTVHASFPHIMHIPPVPKKPELENKIYLALFLSDGDNVQYCQHRMSVLWEDKDRGSIPLNWTVSPGLVDIGPGILNYFYDSVTDNDCFSSGPSGLGYALIYDQHNKVMFLQDQDKTDAYTKFSHQYLTKNGMRVITIWDQVTDLHYGCYEKNCRSLYGVTMEDWFKDPNPMPLHVENGRLPFMPNRPAYAETLDELYEELEQTIRDYDGTKPLFLAAQGVTWSLTPENIRKMVEQFNTLQPGKVEVLRGDHFFTLLNEAMGNPFNLALSKKVSVTVNDEKDPAVILNGSPYGKNLWEASEKGEREFIITLPETYLITRYVLKHPGVNLEHTDQNNRAFSVAVSEDAAEWTLLDSRENSEDDITDVDLPETKARYVKLTVTEGGLDGIVRIGDLELYGKKPM